MDARFVLKDYDRAGVNERLGGMYVITIEEEAVYANKLIPTYKLTYHVKVDSAICSGTLLVHILEQMTRLKGELFMIEKGLAKYEC
jgi:hypothetical protein